MRKKNTLLTYAIVLIPLVLHFLLQGKIDSREKLLSQIIHRSLEAWHYTGKRIDDNFSKVGFNEYLKYLDHDKKFFLKSDIEELQKYNDKIDDELESGSTELMNHATERLEQRIRQVMDFYQKILAKKFDFKKDEYVELDADKRDYFRNQDELKEYWRKILKNYILTRYLYFSRINDKKINEHELIEKAKKSVLKSFKSIFRRMLQDNKSDALQRYLKIMTRIYDPHTTYFPPIEKENFDDHLHAYR